MAALVSLSVLAFGVAPASAQTTPGEAHGLLVTGYDPQSGSLSIVWEPACDSLDHNIEFGPLESVSDYDYSGQDCGIGITGSYDQFDPGTGSFFFLVVGNDGVSTEGSYGLSSIGRELAERPEDLFDPQCVFVQDLSLRCDGPVVPLLGMTAYRPQSEGYGNPLQRVAVPAEFLFNPGVGVRVNGDDDDGNGTADRDETTVAGENDLIEVELMAAPATPPEGQEYVLRRSSGNIKAWTEPTKTSELFGAQDEVVLSLSSTTRTIWIENPEGGSATLELASRTIVDQVDVIAEQAWFYPFTSIVIALGGESQPADDPPAEPDNYGMFILAIELYQLGFDVHMYDEDVVSSSGAGAAYDEVVSAVAERGVTGVAIYGYSHGAGSTNDLSRRLDDNRGTIGTFSIDYTGYVDAIDNDSDFDIGTETELPPSTAYHVNYYENPGCGLFTLCGGPIAGADFDLNVNSTAWGADLDHFSIDDAPEVLDGLRDSLIEHVAR